MIAIKLRKSWPISGINLKSSFALLVFGEINFYFSSKPYPKLKLMLLGGKGVGKTTLLQMVRQEGKVPMKNAKDNV
jgi:polynucleotide 5'-kinase involved in rRNA processing